MSPILTQASRFVLVGLILLGLDALCCAALVAAGVPLLIANPLARASAALLGFVLHARLSFAVTREGADAGQPWRYLAVWLLLTWLSTRVLVGIQATADTRWALWLKLPLEAALALCSFLLMKRWVYRR